MFDNSTSTPDTTVVASLRPGPSWFNTFDPASLREPIDRIELVCQRAASLLRPYFVWEDKVYIATGSRQWLETHLPASAVVQPPPPPSSTPSSTPA